VLGMQQRLSLNLLDRLVIIYESIACDFDIVDSRTIIACGIFGMKSYTVNS
jgi:hypothetical protein